MEGIVIMTSMHFTHEPAGATLSRSWGPAGRGRDAERTMPKPWEPKDHTEVEARLAAARQLRRDELGRWLAGAWRALVEAVASLGSRGGRGAHPHRAA
jgi:hypothetical protein